MIKICVSGACGRMGQRIIALAKNDRAMKVMYGLENTGNPAVGTTVDGVPIVDDINLIKGCDCVIEFSMPAATVSHVPFFVKNKICAVIGTTGLEDEQMVQIKDAAKQVPLVIAPNMSVGVNLLFRLVQMAAAKLKGYSVYIEEAHHIHKKDAPSGTAKKIATLINEQGFTVKNEDIKVIRDDEIVGDHAIVFESEFDRIEIAHSAKTRDIFAHGALVAAKWVVGKNPGLYSMGEVLF